MRGNCKQSYSAEHSLGASRGQVESRDERKYQHWHDGGRVGPREGDKSTLRISTRKSPPVADFVGVITLRDIKVQRRAGVVRAYLRQQRSLSTEG